MSNVAAPSNVGGTGGVDPSGMSPDLLLEYCESQLDNYGSQIDDLMTQQQQQLGDQQVVSNLKSQLEQMGTPQNNTQLQAAYQDYQSAIAQCSDPSVKQQLTTACADMCSAYSFNPNEAPASPPTALGGLIPLSPTFLAAIKSPNAPTDAQWQGTTDAVGTIAGNITSNSQIQMMQLQQLASYQQQATELTINLLGKQDSTLLDEAKGG
ncbi:MAG TPA: hypothetical protein VGG39_17775 [Polyangiaceae bacterium]|jgi:hypothetical protein